VVCAQEVQRQATPMNISKHFSDNRGLRMSGRAMLRRYHLQDNI
jgi:hypothetical protein